MFISVCISTFKRPSYLEILLKKINEQELPDGCKLKVIVIDNDINASAKEVVTKVENEFNYEIIYDVESRRGISFSRNKAFSLAEEKSDFVVFIDDDEYPEKDWIKQLIICQQNATADLVVGIVYPNFHPDTPDWLIRSNFFFPSHYRVLKDGDVLPPVAVTTNNLLVKYSLIKKIKGPFNESMGLTGGEDTDLGFNLNKLGCKMVFSNKAIVHEWVPLERANFKWVMQRRFSAGNNYWRLNRNKTSSNVFKLLLMGMSRISIGLLLLIPAFIISLFVGRHYHYKIIEIIARGIGIVSGVLGYDYEEYNSSTHTLKKTEVE